MPNWCQNQLMMTGETPELRAWLTQYGISFAKMNPPRRLRKKSTNSWLALENHLEAWGTKCDLDKTEQRHVANELLENGSAFFDTAWSPPILAITAMSRKFPEVTFLLHYCEIGMFYAGTATFHNGECQDDYYNQKTEVMRIASVIFGFEDEDLCETEAMA